MWNALIRAKTMTDFKGSSKAGKLLPKKIAIAPGTTPASVDVAAEPSPKAPFIPVDTASSTAFVAADVAAASTAVLAAVLVAISASNSGETLTLTQYTLKKCLPILCLIHLINYFHYFLQLNHQ